ncbi:MAG TPA: phenylacetic acid degradation operon negative regulatory protein PaaX [Steroidobacteraceae bacterium]|nr:phenylacetic acid degradation operon negative regulatory protein PaaX [Steroidobacteraceae bacterium]
MVNVIQDYHMQVHFLCHNFNPMKRKASPLPAPVSRVLQRFRAQRPLRGGSLLITLFGDAIAARGGAVTLGSLIRLAAPFGLTERLVRTSVARLARDGWLTARRSGRRSEYRLTRGGAARFAEATRRIYAANPQRWDGAWTLVLLRARSARQLDEVRGELRWLGFGQLTPLLFAHPASPLRRARRALRRVPGARTALLLESRSHDLAGDRRLAARGWDLGELSRRYRRFLRAFAPLEAALATAAIPDEVAFVVRTLLIHEYRKIHLQDPLLPPALLPSDWVGAAAYRLCRRLYARVFVAAERHLGGAARRLHRPLPAATAATRARFGGIAVR